MKRSSVIVETEVDVVDAVANAAEPVLDVDNVSSSRAIAREAEREVVLLETNLTSPLSELVVGPCCP